jgi:hypothetical protein
MSRQESFERHYAEQHDVPVESMAQYRWAEKDGYRLPGISAAYRNYCAGWDASDAERPLTIVHRLPGAIHSVEVNIDHPSLEESHD